MIATARMNTADFKKAATALNAVVERRNTIPILGQVVVGISANRITFCGTNLEQQVRLEFEAETDGKAEFTISADKMQGFAGAAQGYVQINLEEVKPGALNNNNDVVELRTEDITLRCQQRYRVMDFPYMARVDKKEWRGKAHVVQASEDDLGRALRLGRHCISTQETRYYLNGTFLTRKPDGDTLRAVTTDGHRLGVVDTQIAMPEAGVIVPVGMIDQLMAQLKPGGNEPVSILFDNDLMLITMEGFETSTKLIDGKFPNYTRVIPEPSDNVEIQVSSVTLNRLNAIQKHIRRGQRSVACAMDPEANRISIINFDENTVSAPMTGRGNVKLGANFRYLQEQAKATPDFTLQAKDNSAPMRIFSDDPDALFILMPMRV